MSRYRSIRDTDFARPEPSPTTTGLAQASLRKLRFNLFAVGVLVVIQTCFSQPQNASSLDKTVATAMAGRAGAAVVLDVETGRVLAQYNPRIAVQRVAAPGSAVKPFVLIELLRSAKLDPMQRVFCPRKLRIYGRRMDCTHSPAIKDLDATEALAYSCNNYFATVASRLNAEELKQVFERAGFTSPSGLIPNEAVGRVLLAPDSPHLQLQALGEWGVEITPMELVAAYRTLGLQRARGRLEGFDPVFSGLELSVQCGMAHQAIVSGLSVAGKTGTAADRTSMQTHGFFSGYAPADKPEVALVVFLEPGRGSDAAEIAGSIFTAYANAKRDVR